MVNRSRPIASSRPQRLQATDLGDGMATPSDEPWRWYPQPTMTPAAAVAKVLTLVGGGDDRGLGIGRRSGS
jgi:hypothetical protein